MNNGVLRSNKRNVASVGRVEGLTFVERGTALRVTEFMSEPRIEKMKLLGCFAYICLHFVFFTSRTVRQWLGKTGKLALKCFARIYAVFYLYFLLFVRTFSARNSRDRVPDRLLKLQRARCGEFSQLKLGIACV